MSLDDTRPVNAPKHRPKDTTARREMHRRHGITRGTSGTIACAYCGEIGVRRWTDDDRFYGVVGRLELDHVVPYITCGRHDPDNMEWACQLCNLRKGSATDWTSPNGFLVKGKRQNASLRGAQP